jgi:hypothetical protein
MKTDWSSIAPKVSTKVKERPAAKKERVARAKRAVKAIVSALVPAALKPESKPASAPVNPHAGWSEQMRAVDRDMRNQFGDDHLPSFKRGKRGGSWAAGDGATYTFSTHLPENRHEMGVRSSSPNFEEGNKETFW